MESGPQHMIASKVENGPYGLLSLNLRGTLYYPENKVEERRRGASGTLRFDLGNDGNFLFNRSGFAVFALFRPNPPYNQERSTLVRVGPQSEAAPAFFLQWHRPANASSATIISAGGGGEVKSNIISTPRESHPRQQQWELIVVRYTGGVKNFPSRPMAFPAIRFVWPAISEPSPLATMFLSLVGSPLKRRASFTERWRI